MNSVVPIFCPKFIMDINTIITTFQSSIHLSIYMYKMQNTEEKLIIKQTNHLHQLNKTCDKSIIYVEQSPHLTVHGQPSLSVSEFPLISIVV